MEGQDESRDESPSLNNDHSDDTPLHASSRGSFAVYINGEWHHAHEADTAWEAMVDVVRAWDDPLSVSQTDDGRRVHAVFDRGRVVLVVRVDSID